MTIIVSSGSSTTKEAQATTEIFSRVMNHHTERQKIDFVHFMALIRSRNLNIENFLFKINWNVFMIVSLNINV